MTTVSLCYMPDISTQIGKAKKVAVDGKKSIPPYLLKRIAERNSKIKPRRRSAAAAAAAAVSFVEESTFAPEPEVPSSFAEVDRVEPSVSTGGARAQGGAPDHALAKLVEDITHRREDGYHRFGGGHSEIVHEDGSSYPGGLPGSRKVVPRTSVMARWIATQAVYELVTEQERRTSSDASSDYLSPTDARALLQLDGGPPLLQLDGGLIEKLKLLDSMFRKYLPDGGQKRLNDVGGMLEKSLPVAEAKIKKKFGEVVEFTKTGLEKIKKWVEKIKSTPEAKQAADRIRGMKNFVGKRDFVKQAHDAIGQVAEAKPSTPPGQQKCAALPVT